MACFLMFIGVQIYLTFAQQTCTPAENAKVLSKKGCPDLHDSYQCGAVIERVEYADGDSCQGVWHADWKFKIENEQLTFFEVSKSSPAQKDGKDIVFTKKFELQRWSALKSVRELQVALAQHESGEIAVGSWRDEPELTIEERVGVIESVAEAFAFYDRHEDAQELREEAQQLARRRNLFVSSALSATQKVAKAGIDFCSGESSCEILFKMGMEKIFELSESNTQDFCTKSGDKQDYTALNCCGGTQCLFYCMANRGDSCLEFWAPKEPIHCCDGYDYNSQSLRCYDEKRVCPPGMTSCSLAGIFAPAAYCSRGVGKCWEKLGEMVFRVADVLVSIGSMVFSAGASAAGKAAIKTGAKSLQNLAIKAAAEGAKGIAKKAGREAMQLATKTAFKTVAKSLRKGVSDHFKDVAKELMFTYMIEEVAMATTAQNAQDEGWITADDVIGMVDPTGIYDLVNFFTEMEECKYPGLLSDAELDDMRQMSIEKSQKLTAQQISPYFGVWRGRYQSWADFKSVELNIGCDGKLAITGMESQMMLFDEEYVRDLCDRNEPWQFVVNDLWGSGYYDCGYINGILKMQRFDSGTKRKVSGFEFRGTVYGKRTPEIPCQDQTRRFLKSSQTSGVLQDGLSRRDLSTADYTVSDRSMNACAGNGRPMTTQQECRDAAAIFGKPFNRQDTFSGYPKGCFWNHNDMFYFNVHSTGRATSKSSVVCHAPGNRDQNTYFVGFQIEFGAWNTNGCDAMLTSSQCQELADTEQYTRYSRVNSAGYPKGCSVDWDGQVYWNTHSSGSARTETAPICKDKKENAYVTSANIPVEFGPGATATCEYYLSPEDCEDFGATMGDTNGLTEYYRSDWPRGCLVDFNDQTRFIYNYVPDGGEGEGDIEVAPVCKVCPGGSDCGYVLEPSDKNKDVTYYVYRAHAIGKNVRTMSQSQVRKFCEDQGLILATPHNGYDINEILKQTSEVMAKRSDDSSSSVNVEQPNPWGEDLYVDADYSPRIAVGLSCSKWDDCTNLKLWYWEDATAPDGTNFGPYKQGTLIENVRYDPPTVAEQEHEWKKTYMEERACGYYDGEFDADYYRNKPGFSNAELDRCKNFYDNLDRQITSSMRSSWNSIANGNTHPKDQCGFIDWEGGSDGSTTINVGVCDEMDYEVFACNKQTTSWMVPPKSDKQCKPRDVVTTSCNSIFDRESCFRATESSSDSEKDCVWCVHGPCEVNAEYRCATSEFMKSTQSQLESSPQTIVVQGTDTATVEQTSSFELCKIIDAAVESGGNSAAVESGGNSVVQISSWAYPYALIDGAPGSAGLSPEKRNPDPMQKLGEVQCCNSNNKCTRRNPWNSGSNSDCLSGMNDNTKFTLQEAIDLCASVGQDWSLCTREAIAANICGGKGCNHDYALVWAWDPRAISWVHPYALIDGAPGRGGEVFHPDPMEKLGEVQCCNSNNKCTRRNPWNSGSNSNCLSGMNDNTKFTLQEAIDLCASIGQDWSLCTRQEIANSLCKGKGCNHDTALVWAWDPIATLSKEHTLEMLTGGEALMSLSMKILACIGVVASLRYISGQYMKNSEYATIESHN